MRAEFKVEPSPDLNSDTQIVTVTIEGGSLTLSVTLASRLFDHRTVGVLGRCVDELLHHCHGIDCCWDCFHGKPTHATTGFDPSCSHDELGRCVR